MEEKKYAKFSGRLVFVGFGSIGQGTLPLILRHIDMPRDRITILTAHESGRGGSRALRRQVRHQSDHARQRPADSRAPAGQGRFPAQPLGRRVEHGPDRVLPAERSVLSRYLHRAVARHVHRRFAAARQALELRSARGGARARKKVSGRDHRSADARRESRLDLALGEAGHGEHRPRHSGRRCEILVRARNGRASR